MLPSQVEESVDYAALDIAQDRDYQTLGEQAAAIINANQKHDVQSAIINGNWLLQVKGKRPGEFLQWLSQQRLRFRLTDGKQGFKVSESTAYNYMQLATRFGNNSRFVNFTNVNLSRLYELAAPKFPEDQVQKAIDDYIFGADDLPLALQAAVDNGEIGNRKASQIMEAANKVDPALKKILEVRVISDPEMFPLLQQIGEKAPDLLQEIVRTGAIQSGEDSMPLEQANARDVRAAYVEKRFNDALDKWQDTRHVILQHARVEPDNGKITVVLPKPDEPLPPGGNYFITVTYQEDNPVPPAK